MITIDERCEGLNAASLGRFLASAQRATGFKGKVNVLIAGNAKLRELNSRFRGKRGPTDVLSFPPARGIATRHRVAGDIAISAQIAAQNANRLGHAAVDEVKVLILHGMLHLAGYDHESDGGEMAALEQRLRRKLKLPVVLTERANGGVRRQRKR